MGRTFVLAVGVLATSGALAQQQQPPPAGQQGQQQQPPAAQQGQQPPAAEAAAMASVSGVVDKVDREKRKVTLRLDDGQKVTVKVPEQVRGFERLEKGARVDLNYVEAVAVAIQPPGEAPPQVTQTQRMVRLPDVPGTVMMEQTTLTARIVSVDATKNRLTLEGPGGEQHTVNVKDPAMQARLSSLKAGQSLQVTFFEGVAASITPQGKAS